MKHKILLLFTKFETGGAEKEALSLLKFLDKRKFDTALVCLSASHLLRKKIKAIKHVKIFNQRHPLLFPANIFTICRILLSERPEIILSMMGRSSLIAMASRIICHSPSKLLIWHHIHFTKWIENGCYSDSPKLMKIIQKAIIRFVYPRADRILTITNAAKADLTINYGMCANKITVIPSMIDINQIKKLSMKRLSFPSLDAKFKLKLIYIGRLVSGKGVESALQAFGKITKLFPNIILFIIGVGKLKNRLISVSKKLGFFKQVKFLGYLENPYPLIQSCDVAVLPFTSEGRPHAILEAMILKTPVISSDFPGYQECIHHKITGLVCKKGDIDCLANSVATILCQGKLKRDLVESAYKFVRKFDVRIISKQYEKIFKQIL